MELLARLYARRIINVNVNVLTAGVLALALTAGVMHVVVELRWHSVIVRTLGVPASLPLPGKDLALDPGKVVITTLTFLVDLVADLAVYYVLHWYANHVPSRFKSLAPDPNLAQPVMQDGRGVHVPGLGHRRSFMRDATRVQVQRMALSPLLYLIALGGQNALLHMHMNVAAATAIAFGAGLLITRFIHTMWMLAEERKEARLARELAATLTLPATDAAPMNSVAAQANPGEHGAGEQRQHKPVA